MRTLLTFFLLTFVVTWTLHIVAGAMAGGTAEHPVSAVGALLFLPGTFAPGFVALALTARDHGRAGVRALLGRLFAWQVGGRWYVFAVSYVFAIRIVVAVVYRLATGAWPAFTQEPWYLMIGATVFSTVVGGQAGEEIGWRGYALPRLAAHLGLARASVVLGIIWAAWHLPLFFIPGTDTTGQSFPLYLAQVIALSVSIAWLYWRTNGSLLLAMLMHSAINNISVAPSAIRSATDPFALSPSPTGWLTAALLWVGAGYFLVRMSNERLPVP